jgi:hypothetical protein
MTERKLTSEEINQLFDFCQKRNVKEYEIQAELVDHLASSIETQLEQNASLSFFEALNTAVNDFGTNGFKEIVKIKRRMFRHKYNLLFLRYLVTFFQLPRVILTLALILSLYSVFCYFDESQAILKSIGSIAIFLNILYMAIIHPPYQKEVRRSFIIIYYFNRLRISTGLILSGLFFIATHYGEYFPIQSATWLDLLISFLIVFIFIVTYILMIYMPKLLNQHFKEQFPNILYSVL